MKNFYLVLFVWGFIFPINIFSQCDGGDPSSNNPTNYSSSLSIEENFNNARRWEETNLGLSTNCLGNMTEPSGGWASMNNDEKALYIHNSEREARGKIPFYGIESNLDGVAQAHSDWQINNNVFSHGGDPALGSNSSYTLCSNCSTSITGSSPFDRMNQSAPLANQWESESENLASNVTSGGSISDFVARSIYRFIYQDAGSNWGHRHNILAVYNDNWGDSGNEGFIGVGVSDGNNWESCAYGCGTWNFAKILTIDYYDPQGSASGYSFSTLPIELLSFEGYKNNQSIDIKWDIKYSNIDFFELQKSIDGIEFNTLSFIESNNLIEENNYIYSDNNPAFGTNFYRLISVDFDGNKVYSKIIGVNYRDIETVSVFPNPFETYINLSIKNKNSINHIIIYDLKGNIVFQKTLPLGNITDKIDLSSLRQGIYYMNVKNSNFEKIFKLIKL